KGSRQVIEHVVATTEDHAWFQDRPFQRGRPDDFLRCPFRLVICGAAIRSSTQKAEERDASYPRLLSRMNHVPRTVNVHHVVRLATKFSVDAGTMGHRVAACKRPTQSLFIDKPRCDQAHTFCAQHTLRPWTAIDSAGDDNGLVTLLRQADRQMTANEPGTAGDGDLHRFLRAKQIAGDDFPLDLRCPFVDAGRSHFTIEMLKEMPLFEGDGAV